MTPRYEAGGRRIQSGAAWAMLLLMLAVVLGAFAPAVAAPATRTVLVMGDSLSAGYGMAAEQGWVALTADRIAKQKPQWRVVNASISGETTAGGRSRILDAVVRERPEVVVIALGANDGLRGLPTARSADNLAFMIGAAHGAGAKVLLIGMQMPPNLGASYTRAFEQNYRTLANRFNVALLPFLLQPIAADRDAYQDDNLHPTAAAQPQLRDHVWTALAPLLD
ncbi:arylesterase [Lysobacter sp. H23M47]|uniref:arylesterase n=1 Tax=Lysobacter sp. H23M47 TaxID=2781024 RepID=UPI001D164E5D|nr:arylesterase [Lysobacter sp. H23M47]